MTWLGVSCLAYPVLVAMGLIAWFLLRDHDSHEQE